MLWANIRKPKLLLLGLDENYILAKIKKKFYFVVFTMRLSIDLAFKF